MTEKRLVKKNFTPMGSIIEKVLNKYRPMADRQMIDVWKIWETAVDPGVSANARPAAFKGSILLVHVSNSIWLHHLRFMENELIDRINTALGEQRVKSIHLKIGPV